MKGKIEEVSKDKQENRTVFLLEVSSLASKNKTKEITLTNRHAEINEIITSRSI